LKKTQSKPLKRLRQAQKKLTAVPQQPQAARQQRRTARVLLTPAQTKH
jgi:hypothetical protein